MGLVLDRVPGDGDSRAWGWFYFGFSISRTIGWIDGGLPVPGAVDCRFLLGRFLICFFLLADFRPLPISASQGIMELVKREIENGISVQDDQI